MSKDSNSKEKAPTPPATAGSLWRDRLNQAKSGGQHNQGGTKGTKVGANVPNRFQNTASKNASQKTRKGMRAG